VGSGAVGASFQGIILAATQVTIVSGSTVTGRIYSQTGIAIQNANIMQPQDNGCGATTVTVSGCECFVMHIRCLTDAF